MLMTVRYNMSREIFPSSYECDCGHISDFFEGTIWNIKKMSMEKEVRLADDDKNNQHFLIFYRGKLKEIICPKQTQEEKD